MVLPTVSTTAREIYAHGLALGNNPHAFSKVGDCNSVTPYFLERFDKPALYRLGGAYAYLQSTIDQFRGSFAHQAPTTQTGLNMGALFDPTWADPRICRSTESPLSCEYRLQRPSIVFISLGTNEGWRTTDEYESRLREVLEFWIARGVVPILSTKADNVEGEDRFNGAVIALAHSMDLPLWNFRQAVAPLPNNGLVGQGYHLTWGPLDFTGEINTGWQMRNLTALQALEVVWEGVR
jgi:hypothetical protein